MVRPLSDKKIKFDPKYTHFKPEGCPESKLNTICITPEEAEALRLKNIEELDQTTAAKKMGVSQSTFQRILASAYKKVSEGLIFGKELQLIEKDKKS